MFLLSAHSHLPHWSCRFQTANETYDASLPVAERIAASFAVREVDPNTGPQLPSSLRAF